MPIHCEIVSQDRIVYQGEADIVVLPGAAGEMGILPHHSPLLSVLQLGVIEVRSGKDQQFFTVAGGIAEVHPDKVIVLADAAENISEIDAERAEAARRRAEQALKEGGGPDTDNYLKIQAALRRSNLRLNAVRKYHPGRR